MNTYTTFGPSLWGKNRFNENEKLIIEILSFKFINIFINKFTIYYHLHLRCSFVCLGRVPIFNYWWVIDQKYHKISKRKLKRIFINFIKNCASELKNIDNLNDKIKYIHLSIQEEEIEKKYQFLIEKNIQKQ